jgi:predicted DNA-binding transcriptional regulator AlpA
MTMHDRLIRRSEVQLITGLTRYMIDLLEEVDGFPKRVQVGDRNVFWSETEIVEFVERTKQQRVHKADPRPAVGTDKADVGGQALTLNGTDLTPHQRRALKKLEAARPASGDRPQTHAQWKMLQDATVEYAAAGYCSEGEPAADAWKHAERVHGGRSGRLSLDISLRGGSNDQ